MCRLTPLFLALKDPDILETQSDQILTGVVQCMQKEEPNTAIRHTALIAFLNAMDFCRNNFDREVERHFIMQVICEATQSTDPAIAVPALQCLVRIMSLYYRYMEAYMAPALFGVSHSIVLSHSLTHSRTHT